MKRPAALRESFPMRRLATLSIVAAIAAAGFGILLQAGIPQVPTGTWAPAGFLADARMDSENGVAR